MSRFQFRYESVLEQRRQTERQRQRELAELQNQQQSMKTQLRQMQQTIDHSRQQITQQLVGQVDLNAIGSVSRYSAQVTLRGQQLVQQLASVEHQVDQARQRLMAATQQRKIMEQLRQREYEQFQWHQRRAERRQQDELANQQYVRQQQSEDDRCAR
jgi:flagellar FliJ protein